MDRYRLKSLANFLKRHVKENWLAIALAAVVGLIYVAPNLFFIVSLGDKYRGIPLMESGNEDFYLARIQEIIDGHPALGSFAFFEGKEQSSLTPATAEFFYALPSWLFNISPINAVIAGRFILPFLLFILVYFLIKKLTGVFSSASNKINAIAGALLVTVGYNLVDFPSLWAVLTGQGASGFLIWSRPVNPIIGAIFLFSFLLCLWLVITRSPYRKSLLAVASVFLALMIASYFFSWGLAISILAFLSLGYLVKKEYKLVRDLAVIIFGALILSAPYWYLSWQASRSPDYQNALLRNGLFYTHFPLGNKLLFAALLLYGLAIAFAYFKRKTLPLWNEQVVEIPPNTGFRDWQIFCLALLLAGIWAFNQQIITGRTIWPFHFVQYTIPLMMIVFCVGFYNLVREGWPKIWQTITVIVILSSLGSGIYSQISAYKSNFNYYAGIQYYQAISDWLNSRPKDCVVFVLDESLVGDYNWNGFIPAFTHCNVYASSWAYNLLDAERRYFNYLSLLRLKGVSVDEIDEYVSRNRSEIAGYLFSNWKGIHTVKHFPDFSDELLEERIKKFPREYREFYAKDFRTELNRYRLDYILSVGPLPDKTQADLGGVAEVFLSGDIFIYKF